MELIVTADDFGYSPSRDDTIIDCYQNGILTGTSLMVNGATALTAAEKAKTIGLRMGLHFNISEGIPISDPSLIPSLVVLSNESLQLRGKEGFITAENDLLIRPDDVERELRSQLNKFISLTGEVPDYVDGHQHVHTYPHLAETIARVLCEYHITRTRFPSEDMDEVGWMNNNSRKSFRQQIYLNSMQSVPIYKRYGVFGGYGIGSTIGGESLTIQRLLNCCQRYPRSESYITTIELMTHPGAPEMNPELYGCGIGCDEFSQSEDRIHEHHILTDPHLSQYLADKSIKLCSYRDSTIGIKTSPPRQRRVLLLLSLKEGTGNTITGTRVATHLLHLGYTVQLIDSTDMFDKRNIQAILRNSNYNENSDVYVLFCIHALRAGVFGLESGYPYIVMLGGTDINVNVNDSRKVDTIRDVLSHSIHIIAFTEDMRQRTLSLLEHVTTPPITVISQSVESPCHPSSNLRSMLHISSSHHLILLPSGIRPVKDILYLLSAFSSYHAIHMDTVLCIMGPVLDTFYADTVFSHIPEDHIISYPANYSFSGTRHSDSQYSGVFYVPSVPHNEFMSILMDADIIINSSLSEGLAAIVVEAWSADKIVIARNNPGNASTITNGVTGLLFDSAEEFIGLMHRVLTDSAFRNSIITSSKRIFEEKKLFETERNSLTSILNELTA